MILPIAERERLRPALNRSLGELATRTHQPEVMQRVDYGQATFTNSLEEGCRQVEHVIHVYNLGRELVEQSAQLRVDAVISIAVS